MEIRAIPRPFHRAAPSALDLVGSEIAFNPTIRFTSATDCTYDNTLATENTLPRPATGLIQATYTAVEEAGAITIKVSSTDSSFTEDLILVMTGWRDLDQDGFIDQFTIRASLADPVLARNDRPVHIKSTNASGSGSFLLESSGVCRRGLEPFADLFGMERLRRRQAARSSFRGRYGFHFEYAKFKRLHHFRCSGNTVQGTYSYERLDDSSGRLTVYESRSYGNPQQGATQYATSTYVTSQRQAVFTLNFYNTDPLSDSIYGKPGGLGIHFHRTTDIEKVFRRLRRYRFGRNCRLRYRRASFACLRKPSCLQRRLFAFELKISFLKANLIFFGKAGQQSQEEKINLLKR